MHTIGLPTIGLDRTATRLVPVCLAAGLLFTAAQALAQSMQPGEAYVTRFSGTTDGARADEIIIDPDGTVGSIIDVRSPGRAPQGQHWIDEPQRQPLKASEVGQIFGVTLDGENPPNIYVAATAAFGLHRTPDNKDWMPGMWGPGGPGAVYKIDSKTGRPSVFAQIGVAGRPNGGASLGNIAYDRWNRQFFVSDLETGMIHRLGRDGAGLSAFDHGAQGRPEFFDAESKQPAKLPPIAFDPATRARIDDCPGGPFAITPQCWNLAASGRRVWGLGVARDAQAGSVRLYYAVWSTPDPGNKDWQSLPDDQKRNSIWSVQLGSDGDFAGNVRREFLLPDFFETDKDVARAGYSHPVSDIAFPVCGNRGVMLVAERGGLRNLGLDDENPFAVPHEARLLRYEIDQDGIWRAIGRYDVGFRERQPEEGPPAMQANCSGGAAFGYGYDQSSWRIDRNQPDQFVWTSGDSLCSALGPCNAPGIEADDRDQPGAGAKRRPGAKKGPAPKGTPAAKPAADSTEEPDGAGDVEVHGIQGIAEAAFQPIVPPDATGSEPKRPARAAKGKRPAPKASPSGQPPQGSSLNESYMIDADVNIDPSGNVDEESLRNDATMIGDIAIYQICEQPPTGFIPSTTPPAAGIGHDPKLSHSMYESHGRANSHFRFGSHSPYASHSRYQSHYRSWSHYREASHNRQWSHERRGSIHNRQSTHLRYGSEHNRTLTHQRLGTVHNRILTHQRYGSPHDRRLTHKRHGSPHDRVMTHKRQGSPHDRRLSHERIGSPHNRALTHARTGSPHNRALSHERTGSPHRREASHKRAGSPHSRVLSHRVSGSGSDDVPKKLHTRAQSKAAKSGGEGGHSRALSLGHRPPASPAHAPRASHARTGSAHNPRLSHVRAGSPGRRDLPKGGPRSGSGQHPRAVSHQRSGSRGRR